MMLYLGYILLISCMLGIIFMALSFFLFFQHRKEYRSIIESYHASKLEFPMPYNFQSMIGFFGAYPVSRFFLGLKENKKIFFIKKESNAYSFFLKNKTPSIEWMKSFCFFWKISVILVFLPCLMASVIHTLKLS